MNSVRPEAFEDTIHKFFQAAAVPAFWPEALQALAEACGAEGVAAHSADGLRTFATVASVGASGLYQDFVKRWRAPELNSHRSRGLALLGRGWRGALTETDIFTPEEIARDPFHQEFILPSGFSSFAGIILAKAPGLMMSASIYRRPAQGRFARSDIEAINKLVCHLQSAGAAAMRIGVSATARVADAFTASGQPVALIGRDGRIIHMSPAFERLINDGVHLKGGRLGSWQVDADRSLAAAIHRAINYDGEVREPNGSIVLPRRNGLRPLVAAVIPVVGNAHDILHHVAAIAVLTDLEAERVGPAEALLQAAFGLTPAEARLATRITTGNSLPDISKSEDISHETLRTRLKSIFDKTGTSRQIELALLLSKLERPHAG